MSSLYDYPQNYDEVPVCSLASFLLDEIRTILCVFANPEQYVALADFSDFLFTELGSQFPQVAVDAFFALDSDNTADVLNRCLGKLLHVTVRNYGRSVSMKTQIGYADLIALHEAKDARMANKSNSRRFVQYPLSRDFTRAVSEGRDAVWRLFLERTRRVRRVEGRRPPPLMSREVTRDQKLTQALWKIQSPRFNGKLPNPIRKEFNRPVVSVSPQELQEVEYNEKLDQCYEGVGLSASSPVPAAGSIDPGSSRSSGSSSQTSPEPEVTMIERKTPQMRRSDVVTPTPSPALQFEEYTIPDSLRASPVDPLLLQCSDSTTPPPPCLTPENLEAIDRISRQVAENLEKKKALEVVEAPATSAEAPEAPEAPEPPSRSLDSKSEPQLLFRVSLLPPPGIKIFQKAPADKIRTIAHQQLIFEMKKLSMERAAQQIVSSISSGHCPVAAFLGTPRPGVSGIAPKIGIVHSEGNARVLPFRDRWVLPGWEKYKGFLPSYVSFRDLEHLKICQICEEVMYKQDPITRCVNLSSCDRTFHNECLENTIGHCRKCFCGLPRAPVMFHQHHQSSQRYSTNNLY